VLTVTLNWLFRLSLGVSIVMSISVLFTVAFCSGTIAVRSSSEKAGKGEDAHRQKEAGRFARAHSETE
jgi:hypothetical protein